jgi:hypothetical protein
MRTEASVESLIEDLMMDPADLDARNAEAGNG